MSGDTEYAKAIDLRLSYDDTIHATENALKEEGFGILTRIDVKDTLKQKLGVDFEPYIILGACNPQLAHQALENEEAVGILMPCNVVVKTLGAGFSRVFFTDVRALFGLIDKEEIASLADEVDARLGRVLASLKKKHG